MVHVHAIPNPAGVEYERIEPHNGPTHTPARGNCVPADIERACLAQRIFDPLRGRLRGGCRVPDGLTGQKGANGDQPLANAPARFARQGRVDLVQSDAK